MLVRGVVALAGCGASSIWACWPVFAMSIVPVGEWLPDIPALNSPGTNVATNVIPISPKAYAPMLALGGGNYSPSLANPVQGSISQEDNGGFVRLWAATQAATPALPQLWMSPTPLTAWVDQTPVTPLATVAPSSPGGALNRWRFAKYNTLLIATQINNQPQKILLDPGTLPTGKFDNLSPFVLGPPATGAPSAGYIAVINAGFVILGNVRFPTSNNGLGQTPIFYPNRVWWSAIGAPTLWPMPGTAAAVAVQSSFVDLPNDMGAITGLVPNLPSADCTIFMERGIIRMLYVGGGPTFSIQTAVGAHGTPAPDSIVRFGNLVYYQAEDGLYAYDGTNSNPIGNNKADRFFLNSLNAIYSDLTIGVADFPNKCIRWFYGVNAPLDTQIVYSVAADRLSTSQPAAFNHTFVSTMMTQTTDGATQQFPMAFNTANTAMLFRGPALAATIGSSEAQIFPNKRSFVRGIRPLVDGGSPTISVSYRQNQTDALTVGPAVSPDVSGICPQRIDARFVQATMNMPAGAAWTQILGFDVDAIESGMR